MDGQAFYTQTGPGQFDSSPLTSGPWIGMDSRTLVTPGAGAMTQTTVFDAAGTAGLATQTLVA